MKKNEFKSVDSFNSYDATDTHTHTLTYAHTYALIDIDVTLITSLFLRHCENRLMVLYKNTFVIRSLSVFLLDNVCLTFWLHDVFFILYKRM